MAVDQSKHCQVTVCNVHMCMTRLAWYGFKMNKVKYQLVNLAPVKADSSALMLAMRYQATHAGKWTQRHNSLLESFQHPSTRHNNLEANFANVPGRGVP